jgi:hypothetical protein
MKTFREFTEIAYNVNLIEKTFSTKKEAEDYHRENPPFGGEPYRIKNKARSGEPPQYRPVRKSVRAEQERRRRVRLGNSSPQTKQKLKLAKKRGLEAHHITPGHSSPKNTSANKLYLGNDRRNIQLVTSKQHKTYHGIERKFKDIIANSGGSISLRDLVSAYERRRKRALRKNKQ